jgi:N6-L-threonylcarbamoyladenine synthase
MRRRAFSAPQGLYMKILAIETSCDETALAIVECSGGVKKPQFNVLKNLVHSQIELHREWGGVVPSLAKREHIANLPKLLKALNIKNLKSEIDAIAVTVGPGLEPALWAGIVFAEALAAEQEIPLLGANHMEGHMYSILLAADDRSTKKEVRNKNHSSSILQRSSAMLRFPAIGLVVSGGHTILVKMDSYTKWQNLGETRDDAAGEAFDKVARLLKLPYPGGPEISKLAQKGDSKAVEFPRPMLKDPNFEFSFSGIKTSVLYHLRDNPKANKADVAASFQQAVLDVLVKKTMRAAREYGAETVFICGGVAANKELRHQLSVMCSKFGLGFLSPAAAYNTDNAAMIAAAAYLASLRKKKYKMVADSTMTL